MILYFLRFSIGILICYIIYKVFLEKEKSHLFNRFYLITGLIVSTIFPFLIINTNRDFKEVLSEAQPNFVLDQADWHIYLIGFYGLVSFILLIQLVVQFILLINKAKKHKRQNFEGVNIILVKEMISPFTFLNYVFVNENEFKSIPQHLLVHEITHAKQKHTLDIIIIEVVMAIFWFNPLLVYYKRAIQLNHEFLADQGVIINRVNIRDYQHMLLNFLNREQALGLSSSLNFALTKKRFQMMTKTKSQFEFLKKLLTIPVIVLLILFCSDKNGVSAKNMSLYLHYTHNLEEQMATGEGLIETRDQYNQLTDIYQNMDKQQKQSVNKLPIWLNTTLLTPQPFLEKAKKKK